MRPVDSSALRTQLVCLGLFLGTLLLFSRGAGYGFSEYDDPSYLTNNPHVQGGLSWSGARWAFTGKADYWHPVTWLSHMADWQLYGNDARGHHATSVFWHALNAVLVLLVFRRLTGAFWASALCAALFAWHPLRVESVVWITERKDVMSGFFFLLTIWAYLGYAGKTRAGDPAARRLYGCTLAAFIVGLMSKPMLVTVPGVLLLLDFWPLRRFERTAATAHWLALVREKIPFFALSAAASAATVLMQANVGAFTLKLTLSERLANAVVSVPRYLGKFFWPFDLAVCYVHPGRWPSAIVAAATVFVLAVTALAIAQRHARPWLPVGWFWFVGMLTPTLGLVQVGFQSMADRYTYLPILGVQLALIWTLRGFGWTKIPRAIRVGGVALLLAGCAGRTWDQESAWKNTPALFEHALTVTGRNYMAHFFLGSLDWQAGRTDSAIFHCERALEIKPDHAASRELLADIRRQQGRFSEAADNYRRSLQAAPEVAKVHYKFGILLLEMQRPTDALAEFQAARRLDPTVTEFYSALAQSEILLGHPETAEQSYRDALARHADDAPTLASLADLMVTEHRLDEARALYENSLRLNSKLPDLQLHYAALLRLTGHLPEALGHFQAAVALDPKNAAVHFELARTFEELGRLDEALAHYTSSAKLAPHEAAARCKIGRILLDRHQLDEASAQFRTAAENRPDFAPAYLGLGLVANKRGQSADALAQFAHALACDPKDPAVHLALGDAVARHGDFEQAIRHYRAALALNSDDATANARLGFALYVMHRFREAAASWETALRLDPKLPGLRERLEKARRQAEDGAGGEQK